MEALGARPDVAPREQVPVSPGLVSAPPAGFSVLLVASTATAWTAAVGALATWRHNQFLSHRYDLGNMVQAVWSSAHGRPLEVTDGATGEQIVRLASHVDPILVLFVPLWWLHPAPETLIVAQAAALAAGLYPVVRLAQKYVGSSIAVAFLGAWYLIFPWVLWNGVNDVHPVTLAIPLLLWAIWLLDEHRLGAFAIVAALAMSTGELVGLTVAMLGVWYAIRYRRVRAGLCIGTAGAAWTAFCLVVLLPALNDGKPSRFYDRFDSVGGSPSGVIHTLLTDPVAIFSAVSTEADLEYVVLVLIPTAFLALGSPLLAATALPQLGVNVLSDFWSTTQPMFQYVAPMVAPLAAATIVALGRFPEHVRARAAAAPLAASAVCLLAVPPVPGGQDFVFSRRESTERIAAMHEALSRVPSHAAVMSTNRLGAHLSARRQFALFPDGSFAEWAVIDTTDAWLQVAGEKVDEPRFDVLLWRFENESSWEKVFDDEGIRVYRKRLPRPT